ncbi:F-box domain-containing protein [Mycena chlorophos]|uniref:F-box domain-containing protein n=1 Tax=Mycena chlorophos TaxID=658473 RepID=A0A8H6WGY8_MYCCL|nr:F-box domain-containing protein [Mycena chlorophos]
METPTTESLPIELIDQILSHLIDGSPTIRACSSVSRDWHTLARYYHSKGTTWLVWGTEIPAFIDLLNGPHSTACRWLSGLALLNLHDDESNIDELLTATLPRFAALQRLRIAGCAENHHLPVQFLCRIPPLLQIHSLVVKNYGFNSLDCVVTLLDKFPGLKEFKVDNVRYSGISNPEDRPCSTCPARESYSDAQRASLRLSLTSLDVESMPRRPGAPQEAPILGWLGDPNTAPSVANLRVVAHSSEFQRLLNTGGPRLVDGLKGLHVDFERTHYLPQKLEAYTFPNLHTLRLGFLSLWDYWPAYLREILPEALEAILEQGRMPTLRTLILDIHATTPSLFRKLRARA